MYWIAKCFLGRYYDYYLGLFVRNINSNDLYAYYITIMLYYVVVLSGFTHRLLFAWLLKFITWCKIVYIV